MIQPPVLIADILNSNSLRSMEKGELFIPEKMLNRLLGSVPMPLPLVGIKVICKSGFFEMSVQLDLREQGLPLRPQVKQKFDLERLRLDPSKQFILLKPRGGLYVNEGSVGRRRLSPIARALLTTMLHTPTLLKLIRDRFPKSVQYEYNRLHIDLSSMEAIQSLIGRETTVGHVHLQPMTYLNIHDVDIRKGSVVLRYRFEKAELLETLQGAPPQGFYKDEEARTEKRTTRLLPPPEDRVSETPAERAYRLSRASVRQGRKIAEESDPQSSEQSLK